MLVKEGRRLGVEHMIVTHPMSNSIEELRAQGITQRELDRMTKENPARLLGLPLL